MSWCDVFSRCKIQNTKKVLIYSKGVPVVVRVTSLDSVVYEDGLFQRTETKRGTIDAE